MVEKLNPMSADSKSISERLDNLRMVVEENLRYTKTVHEFTPKDTASRDEEFRKLLKDNLDYTRACFAILEKMNRWLLWQRVFSIVKILLIIVPIVIALIFLPPLLKDVITQYKDILDIK